MLDLSKEGVATGLLTIRAVKLDANNPFTWASGFKMPIYCDNRKTLSYPDTRDSLKQALTDIVVSKYTPDAIVGVATAGAMWGGLVADNLHLPYAYVRSSKKEHGLENLIEGDLKKRWNVVVVEDLVSTGGSSLQAAKAIREAGCYVQGMIGIFSYELDSAKKAFKDARVPLTTLTNYNALVKVAAELGFISGSDIATLKEWRKDPENWWVNKQKEL